MFFRRAVLLRLITARRMSSQPAKGLSGPVESNARCRPALLAETAIDYPARRTAGAKSKLRPFTCQPGNGASSRRHNRMTTARSAPAQPRFPRRRHACGKNEGRTTENRSYVSLVTRGIELNARPLPRLRREFHGPLRQAHLVAGIKYVLIKPPSFRRPVLNVRLLRRVTDPAPTADKRPAADYQHRDRVSRVSLRRAVHP